MSHRNAAIKRKRRHLSTKRAQQFPIHELSFKSEGANLRYLHSLANHLTYIIKDESMLESALRNIFCSVIWDKRKVNSSDADECLDEVVKELEDLCGG